MAQSTLEQKVLEYKLEKSEDKLTEILVDMESLIKYWVQSQCYLPWEKEDLLQVARIAILGALDRFDPDKGIKFKTFAYKTVTGKILNYYRDSTWKVSIPRKYREMSSYISEAERNIYQSTGQTPNLTEIAEVLGMDKEELGKATEAKRIAKATSLSEYLEKEDGKTEFIQFLGKEDANLLTVEFKKDLMDALRNLEDRQKEVIYMRFYKDMTQSKVAKELGVSQMQVSRLEKMALEQLKNSMAISV